MSLEEINKIKTETREFLKDVIPTELLKESKKVITQTLNEDMCKIIKKTYNKRYYEKHHDKILENQKMKAQCALCGRYVIRYNLVKHYQLPICKKIQAKNKLIEDRKNEENI